MERNEARPSLAPTGRTARADDVASVSSNRAALAAVTAAVRDERLEAEVDPIGSGLEWSRVTYLGQSFLVGAYRWGGAN